MDPIIQTPATMTLVAMAGQSHCLSGHALKPSLLCVSLTSKAFVIK